MSFIKSIIKIIIPKEHLIKVKDTYLILRSVFYIGNGFYCPCCEGTFRKFLSLKNYPGKFIMCPRCESLERHRLLWMYLKEKTDMFHERKKVLHIAPEFYFQKVLSKMQGIDYISADKESRFAEVKMDITDIQYRENTFDVVLCNHVLEHITDDTKAMKEIYRVLKPNGWAIMQSPIDMMREKTFEDPSVVEAEERRQVYGQADHVRIYGRDYGERLRNSGFFVKIDEYVKGLDEDKIIKYKLDRDEDIYCCIKTSERTYA